MKVCRCHTDQKPRAEVRRKTLVRERSAGISLDRSCLSLSGSVHTFTFRGPLQRAVQRQLWLVAPPPPSRLSLTTLAPSLLHCTYCRIAKQIAAVQPKCKVSTRPRILPACHCKLFALSLAIVFCNARHCRCAFPG